MLHQIPLRSSELISYYSGINAIYIYFFGASTPKTFVLRDSLQFIWSLIDGRRSMPEIVNELRETFSLPEVEAVLRLKEAIAFLKNENLITLRAP